ncbi:MAG: transporter substrate-binding domain-containing protein [Defluviitaleaceae bacterium]|nr:transporter substrate-binding domain-containing protein [Defluviitaleaceae bacterium]
MKKIFLIATLAIISVLAFAACADNSPTAAETGTAIAALDPAAAAPSNDVLIMGTSADFPPFEFIAEGGAGRHGHYDGIDVAIALRIAERAGRELVIQDLPFDGLLMALNAGSIDFIASGMTITAERQQQVNFSVPYFEAMQYIVVQAGNTDITSAADLNSAIVGVQLATTGDMFATENLDNEPIRYNRINEAIMALRAGQLDAIIIDSATALMFAGAAGDLAIVRDDVAFAGEHYGIATRHDDPELGAIIDEVITEMTAAGEIEALFAEFAELFAEE